MRHKSEVLLIAAMSVFGLLGAFAWSVLRGEKAVPELPYITATPPSNASAIPAPGPASAAPAAASGTAWFVQMRPYCNAVDVDTRLRWNPAPSSVEGDTYRAACYALAGRIDRARELIEGLPEDRRWQASGTIFEIGHPAADAGDELAAGPLMELVVEFWPNHYMALYHAGAAAFERGEHAKAESYLTRFLDEYAVEDGWRSSALGMLERL